MMTQINAMDMAVDVWIQAHMASPFMDGLNTFVTSLGNIGFIWIVTAVLLMWKKPTRYAGVILLAGVLLDSVLVNLAIKPMFDRVRPYVTADFPILIAAPNGSSFPSGHASISFCCAFIYQKLVNTSPGKKLKWLVWLTAAGIAFSRLYLFVHYPTDVIAGILIGLAIYKPCVWLGNWMIGVGLFEKLHLPVQVPEPQKSTE